MYRRFLIALMGFALLAYAFAQSNEPFRMHAYANLVQIPTLVLNGRSQAVPGIPASVFRISLDDGPRFRAVSTRVEGNDPLNIGILLDATGPVDALLAQFPSALADLAKQGLREDDHVSLFVIDCAFIKSAPGLPRDSDTLRGAADNLLQNLALHNSKRKPSCGPQLPLWDAIAFTANDLTKLDGRRVLLVVSQGHNQKSQLPVEEVDHLLAEDGIAFFSLNEYDDLALNPLSNVNSNVGSRAVSAPSGAAVLAFDELVRDNGGLALHTRPKDLPAKLQQWIALLRARYLVEFRRPDGSITGRHNAVVTLEHQHGIAAIRTSGVSIENVSDAIRNDPKTIPSTPSEALYGKRPPPKDDR